MSGPSSMWVLPLLLMFGYPLWLLLCPEQAVRFYRWAGRRGRIDQRRLDALSPRAFRIGGALFLVLMVLILVFNR